MNQSSLAHWQSKGVFIATQLNSTSSCRQVHSVNNCNLLVNVVTQLTQFVGRDVVNENTTDLAVRCSTGSVELSCVAINTPLWNAAIQRLHETAYN